LPQFSFEFVKLYVSLVDFPSTHWYRIAGFAQLYVRNGRISRNKWKIERMAAMAGAYDDRDGLIWLDGELVPWRDANVHILSHAMHYASSVFEGERAYNGKIFKSREHSERLLKSGEMLDMPIPYTVDEIEAAKKATLMANNLTDAYVRAVAWRGAGEDMGVASSRNPVRLAIAVWEWGAYYGDAKMKGAKLDIAKWKRPSPETIPTAAKAAGLYMICTMSKHAAEAKGCSDALFMDYRGYVAEATGANVFFVKDGEVHTPIPDAILNGITRQTVIQMLNDKGITVIERHIMPEELADFEQCWLTGTAAEVTPVGQIGEHRFEVGDITREIAESYEKLVRA
jgi:branched-chain amino acid aminotransferase